MSLRLHAPKVAIVVLTWNGRDLTLDCLDSLRALDYPNYEVIVTDNGSTDGTVRAVRSQYPDAAVIENGHNLGFSGGNNTAIRHALASGADYVVLLNNDTAVDACMVQELISVAESEPHIGIVGPSVYYFDWPEKIWNAGNTIDWVRGECHAITASEIGQAPFATHYVAGCALCINRHVIQRIGLMDPRYFFFFEEVDWCVRAANVGYKSVVVPRARMWHKVSATIKPDSLANTYYMTRNAFLFFGSHRRGLRRARVLAAISVNQLRTIAAHILRGNSQSRPYRDVRLLAARDAILRRWGQMGPDVERICSSIQQDTAEGNN